MLDGTGVGGIGLDIKSDAMWVGTKSGATAGLVASESDATRLRLILEGERAFTLEDGATITPSAEVGVRVDGGDAETGTGLELGAGLRYGAGRVALEGEVRALVAHEESGYEEWGASGTVRLEPDASGRGFSLSLAPAWGNASSGTERLWSARDAREFGPAGEFKPQGRLEAEVGYGLGLPRAPGVMTPYAGLTVGEGGTRTHRTGARWTFSPEATLELEATRREGIGDGAPEHAIGLEVSVRW